ncbi:hypothetical protein BROUX41_004801 [Berkeleyomyces rouxiae]|uniref:uncharacterized protein n=1 Tax=Berkeleyomyces rouxiae TaxID=2035830 RepID=UPI003B79EE08
MPPSKNNSGSAVGGSSRSDNYERRREQVREAQNRHRRRAADFRTNLEQYRNAMQSRLLHEDSVHVDIQSQNDQMWNLLAEHVLFEGWGRINISSLGPNQREYLRQLVDVVSQETGQYPPSSPAFDLGLNQPQANPPESLESVLASFQTHHGQDASYQSFQHSSQYQMPQMGSANQMPNVVMPSVSDVGMRTSGCHPGGIAGASGRTCYHTSRGASACPLEVLTPAQLSAAHRFVQTLQGMCPRPPSFAPMSMSHAGVGSSGYSRPVSSSHFAMDDTLYSGSSAYHSHYPQASSMQLAYSQRAMSAAAADTNLCNQHSSDDAANTNLDVLTPVQALFVFLRRAQPNYYYHVTPPNLDSLGSICSRFISCVPGVGTVISRLEFDHAVNSLLH